MRVERFNVGPFDNNLYLLTSTGSKDAIVVDPSMESAHVLEAIRSRGLNLRRILLTHAHVDHVVMVRAFHEATGAPVWLHADDKLLYERAGDQAAAMGLAWPGSVPVSHWMKDGEDVGIPGIDVRALHTPGHSPGSITFAAPEGLIVGDVLFHGGVGRTDLPGGSRDVLLRTIRERLFHYPPETNVYPGHGALTTIGHEMASNPFVGAHALQNP